MAPPAYVYDLPIIVLDLDMRSRAAVRKSGAKTLGELCRWSPDELYAMKCFGETSLKHLQRELKGFGLRLREDSSERSEALPAFRTRESDFWAIYAAFRNDPGRNLDAPVAVLDLCVRTVELLRSAGLQTVRSLCPLTVEEIRATQGLDFDRAEEVISALRSHGLLATRIDA